MAKTVNEKAVKSAAKTLTGLEVGNSGLNEFIEGNDLSKLSESTGIAPRELSLDGSFTLKASAFFQSIATMFGRDAIENTTYSNKFSRFFNQQETGAHIRKMMFNIEDSEDISTHSNSDLLKDFISDIKQQVISVNRMRRISKTYGEIQTREIVQDWSTLTAFVAGLIESIQTDYEYDVELTSYQCLYNGYATGMIPKVTLEHHPLDGGQAISNMAIKFNKLTREFRALPRDKYSIINQSSLTTKKLKTTTNTTPVVILFEDYNAPTEYQDTIELEFGKNFPSGGQNVDFQRDFISLFKDDFPTEIKALDEDANKTETQISQARELVRTRATTNGFTINNNINNEEIIGFVLDPRAFDFYSMYEISNNFFNPATNKSTQFRHWAHWVHLSMFRHIAVVVAPKRP